MFRCRFGVQAWVCEGVGVGHGHEELHDTVRLNCVMPGPHSEGVQDPIIHAEFVESQFVDVFDEV